MLSKSTGRLAAGSHNVMLAVSVVYLALLARFVKLRSRERQRRCLSGRQALEYKLILIFLLSLPLWSARRCIQVSPAY